MLENEVKNAGIDIQSATVNAVKDLVKNDSNYKLIPSATERAELIQNFIKELKKNQ